MYRRSSIGLLLRGLSIAVIFIVIPLLLLRILENIALMIHNYEISKIVRTLYIPTILICSLASLAIILENLSIFYITSNKEKRGMIFGIITNMTASTVIALLISFVLYHVLPLEYLLVLSLGIVFSSLVPVIFFKYRKDIQILMFFSIIYVSLIPILQSYLSRVGKGYIVLIYVPLIISILSILAKIKESIGKILSKIAFIAILIISFSAYVVNARSIIFSTTFSKNPALFYILESLIISLILVISLIVVNLLFGSDRPLIIESLEPLEKTFEIKLDYLSMKIRERLREFLRSGDKVPLLCSIIEIGKFTDNIDNIEKAVRIVEEYSDIKVPPIALRWQVEFVNYKNLARRLALIKAVIDVLKSGHRSLEEDVRKFVSDFSVSIPRVSFVGIIQRISTILIVVVPFVAILTGFYILFYLIPMLVMIIALIPDAVVFPRKYLIEQAVHAYNKYVSLVSSSRHVRNRRV